MFYKPLQSPLKPSAWLIRDLLLRGLHLRPPFTSCEEQKIFDLWQSLTFASVRTEPQKASNQCCVAQADSAIPSLQALPGMAAFIYRSGIHLAETHILSECLSQHKDRL